MYNADIMLLLKEGLYQHYTWRAISLHSLCIKQVAGKLWTCIFPVTYFSKGQNRVLPLNVQNVHYVQNVHDFWNLSGGIVILFYYLILKLIIMTKISQYRLLNYITGGFSLYSQYTLLP